MIRVTIVEWNKCGITREVFLTRRYAIKIPKLIYGWKKFLCGLLANMQETEFSQMNLPELCPVVFYVPGGWLLVMRRAELLSDSEWSGFDAGRFCLKMGSSHDHLTVLPVELKQDSFGKIDGRIVAIDYGS